MKIYLRKHDTMLHYYNSDNQSLINILETYRIPVEFHCRSGYCGVCRLQLLKGKVRYFLKPLAFIYSREILPCCCLPVSDIELEL